MANNFRERINRNQSTMLTSPTLAAAPVKAGKVVPTKEQVKERSAFQTQTAEALRAKDPEAMREALDNELIKDMETLPDIKSRKAELNKEIELAQQGVKQAKNKAAWLEVAESIGHALTKLGAGAYGLKHNVDMSGLKFDKTDWQKDVDRAIDELKNKRLAATTEISGIEKKRGSILDRLERARAEEEQKKLAQAPKALSPMEAQKLENEKLKGQKLKAEINKLLNQQDMSPAAKKANEERAKVIGKTVAEFEAGGRAKGLQKIRNAEEALELLKDKKTAAGMAGVFGRSAANITGGLMKMMFMDRAGVGIQQGAEVNRLLEQLQQSNIGEVLDSQFAAREADQVLKRGFDATAPKESQIKTVQYMLEVLRDAQLEKEALVEHLNQGGTPETFVSPLTSKYKNKVIKSTKSEDSGTVRVKHPDGRTGTIPRANLQKALEQGFKEAE